MEEKNPEILFRKENKSNQWFCIHDTDKYHINFFLKSFSNVKYKKTWRKVKDGWELP